MIEPRPEILHTTPAHHGAFDYDELARLGLSPDDVIDFSVNSNPYGPPPGVRAALAAVPLERYPDRECIALREKLAARHGVALEHIVVGNGTAELLLLIALAFIRPGEKVLIIEPTFGEYARVARLMGAEVLHYRQACQPFDPDWEAIEQMLTEHAPQVVFVCNPNNPTGTQTASSRLVEIAKRFPTVLFVIDKAYDQFGPAEIPVTLTPNMLYVLSLTKDYALAGLRLGYVIGQSDGIEAVRRVRPAWNVNALAQAAGLAAIDQERWLRETVLKLHEHKAVLVAGLRNLGLNPIESKVHYFLVHVGNGAAFRAKLLHHRIMVRDCASFGLPEYVRIATRTPEENAKLLAVVEQVLQAEWEDSPDGT